MARVLLEGFPILYKIHIYLKLKKIKYIFINIKNTNRVILQNMQYTNPRMTCEPLKKEV